MISFIVPAHNEAEYIARCVAAIHRHAPPGEPREVIVVDNRSTDDTAARARAAGATVLPSTAATIGAVRNEGVAASRGELLVFLDGDCIVTERWAAGIGAVLAAIRARPRGFAGSHPVPPPGEDVFLWRHWFIPVFQQPDTSHIGSAHLICRRDAFDAIGGFDERLETGEDYDICQRMRAAGGDILVELGLVVEHYGFPRTLGHFMRRERWHGRGDAVSLRAFLASRVAVVSATFTAALAAALVAIMAGRPRVALGLAALALAQLVVVSAVRFRRAGFRAQVIAVPIFAAYFLARFAALVDGVRRAMGAGRR